MNEFVMVFWMNVQFMTFVELFPTSLLQIYGLFQLWREESHNHGSLVDAESCYRLGGYLYQWQFEIGNLHRSQQ